MRSSEGRLWGAGETRRSCDPDGGGHWSDQLTSGPSVRHTPVMSFLKPLSKKSLAQSVFEQLRTAIVDGDVPAGDALPSERVLAEHLGVNRQAVREGLKRLEQAGLVSIQQGGATRVLDFRETAGLELLGAMIATPRGINTGIARSVLEMRSAMGPQIARAAARTRGGGRLDALRDKLGAMRQTDDTLALQTLSLDWWGEVVRGSGNLAYQLAYNSLDRTYRQVMAPLARLVEDEVRAFDDYADATACIGAGDEAGAAAAAERIVAHGHAATDRLLAELDRAQGEA